MQRLDLLTLIETGNYNKLKELIDTQTVDPKETKVEGATLLQHAARFGHAHLVDLLIKNNADVNVMDKDQRRPLHYASCNANALVTSKLLKKADINAIDRYDRTALFIAVNNWQYWKQNYPFALPQAADTIKTLWDHQPNPWTIGFGEEQFKILFEVLKIINRNNPNTIDLSDRTINDYRLEHLASALASDSLVINLKIGSNVFSHSAISDLANALKVNTTLRSLDISHAKIGSRIVGDSGFQYLIHALYVNTTLEYLNVKNCEKDYELDSSDIHTLLVFLKLKNRALKHIDFDISEVEFKKLSAEDQQLIRATQDQAKLYGVIRNCLERLATFRTDKKIERDILNGCIAFLNQCKVEVLNADNVENYLAGIAAGIGKFAAIAASDDNTTRLGDRLYKVLTMFDYTAMKVLTEKFKSQNISRAKTSKDVFHAALVKSSLKEQDISYPKLMKSTWRQN